MNMTINQPSSTVHAFEKAGLGKAPFSMVGFEVRKFQACKGAPVQPGASCDFCGEGIMECCIIRDSQGKTFVVGNVCVHKTGDSGLINLSKRAINRYRTEVRHEREAIRIKATMERLACPEIRKKLQAQEHPYAVSGEVFFTSKTMLDWAEYMMSHAGNAGKMQVAKVVEKI